MRRQLGLLPLALSVLMGQTPHSPTWKEFSIGPTTGKGGQPIVNLKEGVLRVDGISPKELISLCNNIPQARIIGPAWLATERYAITANVQPNVQLPAETAGWDKVVEGLLAAFDKADVVALGEDHWRKLDSDLRIRLIRHPDFPKKARFIVVESGNSLYQAILDRYLQGEDVPQAELQQVWQNTTQIAAWDSPLYADFFAAVRDVNRKLPLERRLRVLAGEPPIDWGKVQTRADAERFWGRDESAVTIVRDQVFKKGEKALMIYGGSHFSRQGPEGGITQALQKSNPGRVFVVEPLGGPFPVYDKLEKLLKSPGRPVLLSMKGTPAAALSANESFGPGSFPANLTLGDVADACVYFGRTAEVENRVVADPAIYRETPYGAEVARRRQVTGDNIIPLPSAISFVRAGDRVTTGAEPDGRWSGGTLASIPFSLLLHRDGEMLTGTMDSDRGYLFPIRDGIYHEGVVRFTVEVDGYTLKFELMLKDHRLMGRILQ